MTVANQNKHSPILQEPRGLTGKYLKKERLIYQKIPYSKKAFLMARTKQQDGEKTVFQTENNPK